MLAGFMTMARIGSYYAAMGDGMEFMVIAAAVIGGRASPEEPAVLWEHW